MTKRVGNEVCVGLISDTHGFYHPNLEEAFGHVDLILHAGDIGTPDILDRLETIAPVVAVYGNVDGQDIRKRTVLDALVEKDGVRFWMTHIGGTPGRFDKRIRDTLLAEPPDVFVCGHSHILRIERVARLRNMLFVNPGAAGRQGFHQEKTVLRLYLSEGKPKRADVVKLDGGKHAAATAKTE